MGCDVPDWQACTGLRSGFPASAVKAPSLQRLPCKDVEQKTLDISLA